MSSPVTPHSDEILYAKSILRMVEDSIDSVDSAGVEPLDDGPVGAFEGEMLGLDVGDLLTSASRVGLFVIGEAEGPVEGGLLGMFVGKAGLAVGNSIGLSELSEKSSDNSINKRGFSLGGRVVTPPLAKRSVSPPGNG